MVHDFAITARFVVLTVAPLVIDVNAMLSGGQPLVWKPEAGTRVAVIARDRTTPIRWVHTDAFWAWHYANAYEDDDRIQLDFPGSLPGLVVGTRRLPEAAHCHRGHPAARAERPPRQLVRGTGSTVTAVSGAGRGSRPS